MGQFILGGASLRFSKGKLFATSETVEQRQLNENSSAIHGFIAAEVSRVLDADIQFSPSRVRAQTDLWIIRGSRFLDTRLTGANRRQFGNKVGALRERPLNQLVHGVGRI